MIGKTNSGVILGIINVNCPNVATVTLTQSGRAYRFTQTGSSTSFKLPVAGTWHISATSYGITQTADVTISPGQTRTVSMLTNLQLYNYGSYASGFASGWSQGDSGDHVELYGNRGTSRTATSNGSVNLTGYRTVNATIDGYFSIPSYCGGSIAFEIINGSGATILDKVESLSRGADSQTKTIPTTTWTFDVSGINYSVRFRLRARVWSGGSENVQSRIRLYKIEALT